MGIAFVGGALNTTPGVTTASQQLQWLSTLRARIGYAGFDRMLIYGTAGVAVGQVKETFNTSAPATVYSGSTDSVKAGPTIGGGIEYLITDKLSIKGEGLYYDLGSDTQSVSNGFFQTGKEFRTRGAIFRLGLNYQFGFAATPAPATTAVSAPAPAPAPAARPATQNFIVFFEFDKSSLTPDGQKVVDAAAAAFKTGKTNVTLNGYTDRAGTDQYNQKLSEQRAAAVRAALVKEGVPANVITAVGRGETNTRVSTADGVREPQNRRVEIVM